METYFCYITLRVKTIQDWGWWYKVGEIYEVRPFPHRATRGATLDYCFCEECVNERKGKKLFDMYEVIKGEHTGSIIPVIATEIVSI